MPSDRVCYGTFANTMSEEFPFRRHRRKGFGFAKMGASLVEAAEFRRERAANGVEKVIRLQ